MIEKITNQTIVQLGLITGIVFLSYNGHEGWGWLTLLLFLSSIKLESDKKENVNQIKD
jgi:hypothetical protein